MNVTRLLDQRIQAPITGELKSFSFYLYWYDNGGGGSASGDYSTWSFDFYNGDESPMSFTLPDTLSNLATPSTPTDGIVKVDNINLPVTAGGTKFEQFYAYLNENFFGLICLTIPTTSTWKAGPGLQEMEELIHILYQQIRNFY